MPTSYDIKYLHAKKTGVKILHAIVIFPKLSTPKIQKHFIFFQTEETLSLFNSQLREGKGIGNPLKGHSKSYAGP